MRLNAMTELNNNIADHWAKTAGLALLPLFADEREDNVSHAVLLDGGHGSFAMSNTLEAPSETREWAWSSDLPRHVAVTDSEVVVARWDKSAPEKFTRQSVDKQLTAFYKYLVEDQVQSSRGVVDHLISVLVLRANIGWLDAEYDEFFLDRDNNPMTAPTDFSGRNPTRSPDVTGGIDLTYYQSLPGNRGDLRLNYNFNYEKENTYYYADDLGAQFDTVLEERTISNASITWTSASGIYHVSAFGKNLTDDRYQTAAQSVGTLWTFSNYGPPRTYGVEVGAKLDF